MNKNQCIIPVDETKFNDYKLENAVSFLNEFFSGVYNCSFFHDFDGLYLLITKI